MLQKPTKESNKNPADLPTKSLTIEGLHQSEKR